MNAKKSLIHWAFLAVVGLGLAAPDTLAQLKTLGIGPVTTTKALLDQADAEGRRADLERVTQTLDSQLTSALTGTRKFKVTARTDLESIAEEQALSGGAVSGVDYLVIPTIDGFVNVVSTASFATIEKNVIRRHLKMSLVLKLYDTQNGVLLEAPTVLVDVSRLGENEGFAQTEGDPTSDILRELSREASFAATRKILDSLYPAKVLAVRGSTVTFNRGSGTGVKTGQIWNVFAPGEPMIDPDTGENLGVEEIQVGQLKIVEVNASFSKGQSLEDRGIVKGSVLRLTEKE